MSNTTTNATYGSKWSVPLWYEGETKHTKELIEPPQTSGNLWTIYAKVYFALSSITHIPTNKNGKDIFWTFFVRYSYLEPHWTLLNYKKIIITLKYLLSTVVSCRKTSYIFFVAQLLLKNENATKWIAVTDFRYRLWNYWLQLFSRLWHPFH